MSEPVVKSIPRDELVALIERAVLTVDCLSAADAILVKRQGEQAPFLAFGQNQTEYEGKPCACPVVRAGLRIGLGSGTARFASEFDRAVCAKFGLDYDFDYGVLVVA